MFSVCDYDSADGNGPEAWMHANVLVGIVDEDSGGIIAYCHRDSAAGILAALSLAMTAPAPRYVLAAATKKGFSQ